LLEKAAMQPSGDRGTGHYAALGVLPGASQRQIEGAFRAWAGRPRSTAEQLAAYRRAEHAYHVLADPEARGRHDRQLGLVAHPAWAAGRGPLVRACVRRGLRDLESGRAGPARRWLERAVALAPQDPHARSYLALALAKTGGCLHEAARHGTCAVERRPRDPALWFNLAEVYATAGLRMRSWGCRARGWRAVAAALVRGALTL
jgi:Flp pilus assembly protein TadD